MKSSIINSLILSFEEVSHILGYSKWENFKNVINKVQTACEVSGNKKNYYFFMFVISSIEMVTIKRNN